jgi:hypothetical protein
MSGEGVEYDPGEIDELVEAMQGALSEYDQSKGTSGGTPGGLKATAQVEWAGELQGPNGVRAVNLGTAGGMAVDFSGVRDALKQAVPRKSYTRKGWLAQYKHLSKTGPGRAAMERAGLDVKQKRTVKDWLSKTRGATPQNQARIAQAYDDMRNATQGKARAAEVLTDALHGAYGSPVRFRDIQRFKFDD